MHDNLSKTTLGLAKTTSKYGTEPRAGAALGFGEGKGLLPVFLEEKSERPRLTSGGANSTKTERREVMSVGELLPPYLSRTNGEQKVPSESILGQKKNF